MIIEIQQKIDSILNESRLKNIMLISSSNNELDIKKGSYIGGIRETKDFKIISVICQSEEQVKDLIKNNEKKMFHFFVEAEKKLPYNFKSKLNNYDYSNLFQCALEELIKFNKINKLSKWKPSDLTIKSAINYIREWEKTKRPRQIAIIGLGNIGCKLALGLIEEGIKVKAITRNHSKGEMICNALNKMISKYTIAKALYYENLETCIAESDILVNCASSTNFIDPEIFNLMNKPSLFLDIGKNSFKNNDQNIDKTTLLRCDISEEIKKFVTSEINFKKTKIPQMITTLDGTRYIEPGILGRPGDILVQNINDLQSKIGTIDDDLRLNYE